MIQRLGRILRWLGKKEGEVGTCYIAYVKKDRIKRVKDKFGNWTEELIRVQDEVWVEKACAGFDQSKISSRKINSKNYQTPHMLVQTDE
jgi:hypothetical protein